MFQGMKHFVPTVGTGLGTTCYDFLRVCNMNIMLVGTGLGTTCYDFTLYFDFVSSDDD